jgi:hypothetical protein
VTLAEPATFEAWRDQLTPCAAVVEAAKAAIASGYTPVPIVEQHDRLINNVPQLRLVNELTGEERVIVLDLIRLVAEEKLTVSLNIRRYEAYGWAEVFYALDLDKLLKRELAEMGVELPSFVLMRGIYAMEDWSELSSLSLGRWTWPASMSASLQQPLTPANLLEGAQLTAARRYDWTGNTRRPDRDQSGRSEAAQSREDFGIIVDEHGRATERILRYRPRRDPAETLSDLKAAAAAHGLTVSIREAFVATEETGPGVFLVNQAGEVVLELSSAYDEATALEGAWLNLERGLAHLKDND